MEKTKMQLTSECRCDFWNDSCSPHELAEAVSQGAVGATSNPVIVYEVIKNETDRWLPVLESLFAENPTDTESEIAWKLIEVIGKEAANVLYPVFTATDGEKGRLSLQVNPEFYPNVGKMVEHAVRLSKIAPNIAIKIPCTAEGLQAVEKVTAMGIVVNVTVSFTVPQVVQAAEAIERGLIKAKLSGIDTTKMHPYVTLMVGRLDDQLKRRMDAEKITIEPGYLDWAGVACFKKAYKIFKEKNYKAKLLVAAYRNHMHWSEFLGGDVVLSMTYPWWNRLNKSDIEVTPRMDKDVNPAVIAELYKKFDDFRRAYDVDGMAPEEFIHFGASIHTLNQFISGYHKLLELIRVNRLK
jgi:transaldolase